MKKLLFTIIVACVGCAVIAQDLVITPEGDSVSCKITGEEDCCLYIVLKHDGNDRSIKVAKDKLKGYQIGYYAMPTLNVEVDQNAKAPEVKASRSLSEDENIQVEGNFFSGIHFYQRGKTLTMQETKHLTVKNSLAYEEMSKASNRNVLSLVLGGVGGVCIGWPLGAAIAGSDPNWTMVAVGVGLVAISIPISINATKHAREGVRLYNDGLSRQQSRLNVDVGLMGAGVGLAIRF